jgi:hypothetical protein
MAQSGYTPISLYYSTTASTAPTAGNLVAGELAINTADGKLFYKDSAGVVQVIAGKGGAGVAGGSNTQVQYNSSGSLAGSANMVFDGTILTVNGLSTTGVASFADGTVSLPSITNIGDTNTGMFFPAADTIAFTEGGSEVMRITSAGAVGVGTTTPSGRMTVVEGDRTLDGIGNFNVFSGNTQAANLGGSLALGGLNGSGGAFDPWSFATLKGAKENSTSGNLAGYFVIATSTSGGTLSERMRIDSSGNVGIGTTTVIAGAKLNTLGWITSSNSNTDRIVIGQDARGTSTVFGLPTGSSWVASVGNAVANALGIGTYGGDPLVLATNNTERMRITSAGDVGIGTTAPKAPLQVSTTANFGAILKVSDLTSEQTGFVVLGNGNSTDKAVGIWRGDANSTSTAGGYLNCGGYNGITFSTSANVFGSSSERMRITSAGNALFRLTDSAVYDNNTGGDVSNYWNLQTASTTGTSARALLGSAGFGGYFGGSYPNSSGKPIVSGTIGIFTSSNTAGAETGYMAFSTKPSSGDATERMRIDSSGNLLVGTTSAINSGKLTVLSDVTAGGFDCSASSGFAVLDLRRSASSSGDMVYFRTSGNTLAGYITCPTATTTVYATASDYRLKENIAPMTGALATVSALKPVTYNWKVDGSNGQGFIAHELQAVVPDCVTGEKDAVDADGKPKYQGIDTSFLIATLTAAIQEQQTLINNLTTRLNALEGK